MIGNINKYIKLCLASIFILVVALSANAASIDVLIDNDAKFELLSKDEDIEKNITNVKVIYNPVAAQIGTSFKLAKQSNVVIKLMDALGNELLNLSNSTLEAGMHNLSFDTNEKVPAGFYFIRVSSGAETIVKRISIR